MSQASRSHPEDTLGGKSKASQKPEPANVGNANPHPKQEGDGVHNGVKTAVNRAQEPVKPAAPGRVQQARENGPHGAQTDSQGNNNALKKKHLATKGY